jgi:uncharacterized protein
MNTTQVLVETLAVTAITLSGMLLFPSAKTAFSLLPIAYLLIERHLRRRTWGELGFNVRTFWDDLSVNGALFALLGFIIQPVTVLLAQRWFPAFLEHIQARLPFETDIAWAMLLPVLAMSLVGEEMTYRTLIQGRLAPYVGIPAAVGIASLLFGLAHVAPGPVLVVLTDVGLIVVDSILYGAMFARRKNLWVVWLAHLLGDISGLMVLNAI